MFPQACSIRDPNSGYVFDLNPLNRSQGYVLTGIGKTFVVRPAGAALTGGEDASESPAAGHGGRVAALSQAETGKPRCERK